MRVNRYVSTATSHSRRQADKLVAEGRVIVNGQKATTGQIVEPDQRITLDGKAISLPVATVTVIINKPVGYVVSRNGQGSKTIYDLLPDKYAGLKPIGRLDKDSSGLLVLTNDGQLANKLSHPSNMKQKVYNVSLSRSLEPSDFKTITTSGVKLEDGSSRLGLKAIGNDRLKYVITMSEGRNRQIRRTFEKLGYKIVNLHRTKFADYTLNGLKIGQCLEL